MENDTQESAEQTPPKTGSGRVTLSDRSLSEASFNAVVSVDYRLQRLEQYLTISVASIILLLTMLLYKIVRENVQ